MSKALMKAISVLVDGDARIHLSGTIVNHTKGEDRIVSFTANGHTGAWTYKIGRLSGSRDSKGNVVERFGNRGEDGLGNADRVPFELQLAFPLTMLIWDRARDEWRMDSADEDGDQIIVHLIHRELPQLKAELTVDTVRRLAVSFITPADAFSLNVNETGESAGAYASYES
ncbi:hypothetical protein JF66_21750 [Cryobacterium sp. MLB-32]|uniref:hypothetical protein n=1 Tax=Cryobacterium sp. MLB-32 TaxID=1529318 RepID=UPI0004E67D02|nr:hypothetical protein [Cryobacterium sp. MLB-32]KFF58022.1 hypothetical protein JF66_21750 [Cryobacterium sp. MLB-32]